MNAIDPIKYALDMRLRQLFENNSNCYADTTNPECEDPCYYEGELIPAMTRDKFIEVCRKLVTPTETVVMPKIAEIPYKTKEGLQLHIGDILKSPNSQSCNTSY